MNMVVRGHVLGLALAAAFCLVGHTAGSARNKALSWLFSAPHLQVPAPPPNIAAIVRVLPQMAFDPLKWIKPLDPQVIADYNSGNFYLISGKFEEAIETFSKVLEAIPDSEDALLSRGIAKEKMLLWQEAIDDYSASNEAFKLHHNGKDDAVCFNNIANAETGLGLWKESLNNYRKSIALKGNDYAAPRLGEALVLYQLGNQADSLKSFTALALKYPEFADVKAARAIALWSSGERGIAEEEWAEAVRMDDRYQDLDWVLNVRRWPNSLAADLKLFLQQSSAKYRL